MAFDFSSFEKNFFDGSIKSKSLYEIISNYPDHDFFIELYRYLNKTSDEEVSIKIFFDIQWSYFIAKKYFQEH